MEISEDLQTIIFHYLKQMLITIRENPENSNKYNQRTKLNVVS